MGLNDLRYFGFRRTRGDASRVDSASQGVPALLVPTGDRDMHFASAADEATDWNVANPTHPTWYIHSETTPATDYASFDHDATDFTLNVASANLKIAFDGTDELTLTGTAFSPTTSDGNALGTASLMWGDLFLASGGVINFNNGNVTLTHSAANLAIAGGDVTIASATGLNIGSATQLTVSDGDGATNLIPEVQALGVGTAFAGGALAIGTFNTTNDRTVSPKLAFVKGAAATQVATTAVADNEVVGSIIAYGSDSADFETAVGAIEFVVDDSGGPGAGAIGGSIEFYTTADGGETLTTALTINTAQKLIGAAGMALTTGNFETVAGTLDIQDGGAVTQLTSKATGVTLNTYTGQITLNNAALAADAIVSFTLTNSVIAANDIIVLQHHSVATVGAYVLTAQPGAGSCVINVANRSAGSLSEAIVISFAVIKAAVT